ncbi:hypothetical protein OIDMADRAFT_29267 [Oidiodendron maius Zn]|uniref:Uncharacterized protein n=1 Tax=Oidiodendron maius (strain Zn) TaxID=913774 RepID=A0A0C3CMD9_OIDMZ|nr:hypothetical protein OIDMADRAFT_29267 [Oidiodendron maius Zn]
MVLDPPYAATTCLCQEKRDPWPLSQYPPVIVNYRMEPTASTNHEGQKLEVAADAARRVYQEGTDWRAQMTRPAMPLHGGNPVHAVRDSEKLGRDEKYCEWQSSMGRADGDEWTV